MVTTDPATRVSFFGGAADDPFFLDDTGANLIIASLIANPGNPDRLLLRRRDGHDTYGGLSDQRLCATAIRAGFSTDDIKKTIYAYPTGASGISNMV